MIVGVLFFGLAGLGLIYIGVLTLNGTYKKWYLGPRIFPPQAIVYGAIPFGAACVELSIILMLTSLLGPDIAGIIMAFPIVSI
ncbi:MAG: hypothetical protein H6667_16140 [Ardenticatenaceae bacterium]|nr:hypothetical protein [Ardenticatenaceae bacterium]MCB9443636.1 hypothetical protein [Ardenticatenaceae bacterium]